MPHPPVEDDDDTPVCAECGAAMTAYGYTMPGGTDVTYLRCANGHEGPPTVDYVL